jgi:hypothetical protein
MPHGTLQERGFNENQNFRVYDTTYLRFVGNFPYTLKHALVAVDLDSYHEPPECAGN